MEKDVTYFQPLPITNYHVLHDDAFPQMECFCFDTSITLFLFNFLECQHLDQMSDITTRLRSRCGNWGIRAFRLSLAANDPSCNAMVGVENVVNALGLLGLRGITKEEVAYWLHSSSSDASCLSAFSILNKVTGPVSRDRIHTFSAAYSKLVQQSSSCYGLNFPTVRFLCAEVCIDEHPDVISALVSRRDALFCFFSLWGVNLEYEVSLELFIQFHIDFLCTFVDAIAIDLCRRLWRIPTDVWDVSPPIAPTREASDHLFIEIDANGNGALSLAEVDLAVVTRWPQLNFKPAIMRAFKLADKNGNGTLRKEEFFNFIHMIIPCANLMKKFREIDEDSSGSITFEELRKHKDVLGLKNVSNTMLRSFFKSIDSKGCGRVRFAEFCLNLLGRVGTDL